MFRLILYFVLDCFGFYVFLLIWRRLERPIAYDYTTIPGFNCPATNAKNSIVTSHQPNDDQYKRTLAEIVLSFGEFVDKFQPNDKEVVGRTEPFVEIARTYFGVFATNAGDFLREMHAQFGALACFHWGQRYVVSVASRSLLQRLHDYGHSLYDLPATAFASILLGDPLVYTERSESSELREGISSDSNAKDLRVFAEKLTSLEFQSEIFMQFSPYRRANARFLCENILGKNLPDTKSLDCFNQMVALAVREESRRRWLNAEDLRSLGPLAVMFGVEIELDAHPVPANVPILIDVESIFEKDGDADLMKHLQQLQWIFERPI